MGSDNKHIGVIFIGSINPIEGSRDEVRSAVSYICDALGKSNPESEIKFSYMKPNEVEGKETVKRYEIPGIAAEFCRDKYDQIQNLSEMRSFEKLYEVVIGKFPNRGPGIHGFRILEGEKPENKPTRISLKYNL